MSIIYDALKKAQETIDISSEFQTDTKDRRSKPDPKLYILYVLVVCFGLFLGNIFFGFLTFSKKSSKGLAKPLLVSKGADVKPHPVKLEVTPSEIPLAAKEDKDALVLNGVFFSQDEGYALINNHIVQVGDVVGGATVKQITPDGVELEVSSTIVKLSTRAR